MGKFAQDKDRVASGIPEDWTELKKNGIAQRKVDLSAFGHRVSRKYPNHLQKSEREKRVD